MPTARTPPTAGKLGPADQPEQGVGDCATLEAAKATASASPASAFRPSRADEHNVFFAKLKKREVGDICIWILRCGGFRYYVRSKSQNQIQSFLFRKKGKKRPHHSVLSLPCAANRAIWKRFPSRQRKMNRGCPRQTRLSDRCG